MNVRVRPQVRYVPRRRGFRGLGGDGTDDDFGWTPIGPPASAPNTALNLPPIVGTYFDHFPVTFKLF